MELELQVETTDQEKKVEDTQTKTDNVIVVDYKMVTFSLAGRDYAIDIMNVKEIAKAGRFTYVPNTLPFVLGVYNLRGEIIPILDLRLFFNIDIPERDENKLENLLILDVGDQKFGVVVDKIDKVIGVQKSTIQPPHPLFGDISIKYISGVVESNNRLYVILDVSRIFSSKEEKESEAKKKESMKFSTRGSVPHLSGSMKSGAAVRGGAAPQIQSKGSQLNGQSGNLSNSQASNQINNQINNIEKNLPFIKESLANYKKFHTSEINESWVRHRLSEWCEKKNNENAQIQNESEAEEFLSTFWSSNNDKWWTKEYADQVFNILPDNSAKQIIVWNPGCGKGIETYSLACVLKKRYPSAKIRIYAQDIDLLAVSNAALMSVPSNLSGQWYSSYLTQKTNGEYTFSQDIKDSVLFEYHDCKNTNALPMVDIVFARDILSLLEEASQKAVIADFQEKMKGNAIAILGENESMPSEFRFGENTKGALVAYTKE